LSGQNAYRGLKLCPEDQQTAEDLLSDLEFSRAYADEVINSRLDDAAAVAEQSSAEASTLASELEGTGQELLDDGESLDEEVGGVLGELS